MKALRRVVSNRVKQLAERRDAVAGTLCGATCEHRARAREHRSAVRAASIASLGLARTTLLHPVVIVGGIVALLTIGRSRGMRLVGRLYLLSTAARRLVQTVRLFQGLASKPSPAVRGERL